MAEKPMNYTDLVSEFAEAANITKKDARELAAAYEKVVLNHIKDEGGVHAFKWLVLKTVIQSARVCNNPQTGGRVNVPEKVKPVAKFGKAIKDFVA